MKDAIIVAATLLIAASIQATVAQTAYQLPFASTGNSIELSVANAASVPLSVVTVEPATMPAWIRFKEGRRIFPLIKTNEELPVLFTFSVDRTAPVKREESITFRITSSIGENWTKEIRVIVAPPEGLELFQNYPNPFNPTTTLSYELTTDSRVSLKVFDLLGREVATVIDENQAAGYYKKTFDASRLSSGVYIYQLIATEEQGKRHAARDVMVLAK